MLTGVNYAIFVIIEIVVVIGSIVLHEIGHGWAAYKLGDMTAKNAGRLSLNPIKHLDWFGSLVLPLCLAVGGGPIIGYAKPVPYNPNNLKDRRKGELIVGLAGPCVNLILALVFTVITNLIGDNLFSGKMDWTYWLWVFCYQAVSINFCLMFFNLIPLPPLDGSSIIAPFLTDHALMNYYKVERYALPILLTVMILVPWITGFDPVGWYINHTAGAITTALIHA